MTITEVSKKYALSADTLRYYERIGLVPPVHRTSGGIRDYTDEDCNWVGFIKCMRGAGLPIEVLIDYVALFAQGDSTIDEMCIRDRFLPGRSKRRKNRFVDRPFGRRCGAKAQRVTV